MTTRKFLGGFLFLFFFFQLSWHVCSPRPACSVTKNWGFLIFFFLFLTFLCKTWIYFIWSRWILLWFFVFSIVTSFFQKFRKKKHEKKKERENMTSLRVWKTFLFFFLRRSSRMWKLAVSPGSCFSVHSEKKGQFRPCDVCIKLWANAFRSWRKSECIYIWLFFCVLSCFSTKSGVKVDQNIEISNTFSFFSDSKEKVILKWRISIPWAQKRGEKKSLVERFVHEPYWGNRIARTEFGCALRTQLMFRDELARGTGRRKRRAHAHSATRSADSKYYNFYRFSVFLRY